MMEKWAAYNEQFHASGGVARPTLSCRTAPPALVQTAPIPPPAAKPLPRCMQCGTMQRDSEVRKLEINKM